MGLFVTPLAGGPLGHRPSEGGMSSPSGPDVCFWRSPLASRGTKSEAFR